MAEFHPLTPTGIDEYEAIETALLETGRGRWFLSEFARRQRGDDTERLLGAIAKLETTLTAERPVPEIDRMRVDLVEMVRAISRTKSEIAAIQAPDQDQSRLEAASEALDAIVRTTERATSDILQAAEEVQEVAWTLREGGADPRVCDTLDHNATQIYTACSFQDLTAQRTSRIVHTLRYLEQRLTAMIEIWGADAAEPAPSPGPVLPTPDLAQSDVDAMIATSAAEAEPRPPRLALVEPVLPVDDLAFVPAAEAADETPEGEACEGEACEGEACEGEAWEGETIPLGSVFSDLDGLSVQERMSRFS
ncbi:hypothetical protein [Methylobacterium isbiliense]|jgi:chemotaxis regulatin CheY-phosphate phosphatase CheZ|uniref:Chemotaxis protein CheZ n=1 Tax=Methylobacterium isbiliense TaxID=315478 RepID=A0ABQ4SN46_9HYPH|nr:hypothetical protein [Methylobacterium isbiliense]MDN3625302.1 hypothetical protein [Methylobacterium isbiliense]GJE03230.1 hypothetical protein GMJLKIPL_5181 [Methylobacterium isbiliense]